MFQNNYIKTSKYSLLTFLPLNLLEQFQRIANFYFLCLLLLQLIPQISSLTPVTTAIPLIGVLALTAVKDAYDDIVSEQIIICLFQHPFSSPSFSWLFKLHNLNLEHIFYKEIIVSCPLETLLCVL